MFLNIDSVWPRHITASVMVAGLVGCSAVPSDGTLTENFSKNRTELMRLVEMLKEDGKIEHLWHTSITPKDAIDEKRWEEYRALMSRAKIRGIHASRRDNAQIMFRGDFSSYSRYDKGYIWSTKKPDPLFESLDSQVKHIPPYAVYYRRIEGNWYLYLENQSD